MDFTLNAEQRARFLESIQRHRTDVRRLGQKEVAAKITVAGDLSHEISRFENGHAATVERWLTEPYLPQVARAYGFESPADILRLFEEARSGAPAPTADDWHPSFPGVERATMELPRVFRFVQDPAAIFGPGPGGSAAEAVSAVPPTVDRIAVVVDATSGIDTVRRQLERALLNAPARGTPLSFDIVDSITVRRLPTPAIYVDDWTVVRLLPLLDRLVSGGHLDQFQAARARRMLEQVPAGGLAGLPISLVVDAVATEARSAGQSGHLHRRLVAAEWGRGLQRSPGWALADGERGIYTDFWAEIAVTSGAPDCMAFDYALAHAAATVVLARRGWQLPNAAELAARALRVARVKSVPERERLLGEIAVELQRPTAERLVDGFVGMGLLVRDDGGLRAATPAVAMLASAWGIAERPELLRGKAPLLCLARAGDLMADIAAFGAKPADVRAALDAVPGWAVVDRDHAWIRFAAACPDVSGLGRIGIRDCWSRVLYERSGHGRWLERLWADANEVVALDRALRGVSERLRAHLPVFGSVEEFVECVDVATRERTDALVCHPIIGEPRDPDRSLGALAQLAPWQFPRLDDSAEDAVDRHIGVRVGLGPSPDPREIAAWACLAGFAPAVAWMAGADPASATFGRLPLSARLVAACLPGCSDESRRRAREHTLWHLSQPTVAIAELRRPIRLDEEGLPVLHAALRLDRAPRSVWEVVVDVIRDTGGLPPRTGEFAVPAMGEGPRCALAEALGDVDELIRIESAVETALAAGRLSTHAGEVVAFGVRMSSREQRYRVDPRKQTEHPLTQLVVGLLAADSPGHAAAVALFRLGHPEALRRRARGELVAVAASVERAWLDCWRLADLWDASLEKLRSLLPEGDDNLLLNACPDSASGHNDRDKACIDADTLRRLGMDRPVLIALAVAFSRLRHCRAASHERTPGRGLVLPMNDRLADFCDRLRGEAPTALDLHGVVLQRAASAVTALALAGDLEVLRAWNELCRAEPRFDVAPSTPLALPTQPVHHGVIRAGTDAELMRDTIRHSVAEVLKTSASLRAIAWREASEPGAQRDLFEWALAAGEPFPGWLRAAIERAALRGEGYVLWFKQPAFQRQRLLCIRAHADEEAASLASLWFEDAQKEGDDDLVSQYAELVLEWAVQANRPFLPERWEVNDLGGLCPIVASPGDVGPGGGDEGKRPKGPPWRELVRFFDASIPDARVPRERNVSVLERLWDVFLAAPLSPGPGHDGGEVPRRHLPLEVRHVFDDLARLLLAAGAPGRVEALLRHGVPATASCAPETLMGGIGAEFVPLLGSLPAGDREFRSRAEILQMRAIERFQPPGFDPRWMLGQGPLVEAWAWLKLATRGDEDAVDRLVGKLDELDLGEGRWIEHEAELSALIAHRREVVVDWLLREVAKSEAHADEARGVAVAWARAWGPRSAEMAAWARGGPQPRQRVLAS